MKLRNDISSTRLRRKLPTVIVASLFYALAVSGTIAQPTPTPEPVATPGKCADWPCKEGTPGCNIILATVKKVFEDLIDEAGTQAGKDLRAKLLDPTNGHKKAHQIVKQRLKAKNVDLGDEHIVGFYEPENVSNQKLSAQEAASNPSPATTPSPVYENNHCYHIFYLSKNKAEFDENLKCCYQPWVITVDVKSSK
jgi:hypothetical protein